MNPIVSSTARTFGEFDNVFDLNLQPCVKKTVTFAAQINEPFRVQTMEGDYKQGKPGDYLMQGVKGELYICDKDIFEITYATLKDPYVYSAYQNFLTAVEAAKKQSSSNPTRTERSPLSLGLPTLDSPQVLFEAVPLSDSEGGLPD